MINLNMKFLLSITLSLIISIGAFGQESHIQFRFDNARFNANNKEYSIDIEVLSNAPESALYAINLRMFYEAQDLKLKSFSDFKTGYGLINGLKTTKIGAAKSAQNMFGLNGPAGYINQGIEMKDVNITSWQNGQWEKLVTLNFEVHDVKKSNSICPSLIWDKQQEMENGGFLQGSMGTVASMINLKGEELKCSSALCNYKDLNWELLSAKAPFGLAQKSSCVEVLPAFELESVGKEAMLFQNNPNPFLDATDVSFSLLRDEEVTFTIYDVNGVLLYNNSQYYTAGTHIIHLDKKVSLPSGTHFYKVETESFKSESKRMVKVR